MATAPASAGQGEGGELRHGSTWTDLARLQLAYLDAIIRGARDEAAALVLDAAAGGTDLRDLYLHVFAPAQHELGHLWCEGRITAGTEHLATAITQSVMSLLYPRLFAGHRLGRRMVGACLQGEQHELGVRTLCDFFEMEGWDTFFLGANTPSPAIVDAVAARRAEVLGLSATCGTDLAEVRALVRAVRDGPGGTAVKILVGGAALDSAERCREVGADGFAGDAQAAVERAHQLLALAPPRPRPVRAPGPVTAPPPPPGRPILVPAAVGSHDIVERLAVLHSSHINAQRDLAKQRVELGQLAAHRNELIGMLAHDLRNPLGAVLICGELLGSASVTPEERAEVLADMQSSSRFALGLVDEVLELSSVESGRLKLDRTRVDLAALLRSAVKLEQLVAQRKQIAIRVDAPGEACPVEGDPGKLRQVLSNLLSNAVKYSHPGAEVVAGLHAEGGVAVLEVADRGVGMAPEELTRLFRPFSRLRSQGTSGERSTGLGLAITRRIVEGHGGAISVASTPGVGSTFRVTLPLAAS